MTVVLTWTARVRDWKALHRLYHQALIRRAKEAGASRYRIYRDLHDASRALMVAEFPDQSVVAEQLALAEGLIDLLLDQPGLDDRAWESVGWEDIG